MPYPVVAMPDPTSRAWTSSASPASGRRPPCYLACSILTAPRCSGHPSPTPSVLLLSGRLPRAHPRSRSTRPPAALLARVSCSTADVYNAAIRPRRPAVLSIAPASCSPSPGARKASSCSPQDRCLLHPCYPIRWTEIKIRNHHSSGGVPATRSTGELLQVVTLVVALVLQVVLVLVLRRRGGETGWSRVRGRLQQQQQYRRRECSVWLGNKCGEGVSHLIFWWLPEDCDQ